MATEILSQELSRQLQDLYAGMEETYDAVAARLDFSCRDCSDNCCDSFFVHHTYIEWAYLWEGLNSFTDEAREEIVERARRYVGESEKMLVQGERPVLMCPLNDNGLCSLYSHRLMICRMHGVPSRFTRPDGRVVDSPGCFRCQEIVGEQGELSSDKVVERTHLYREFAALEAAFLGYRRNYLPKVKKTIAQMIVLGQPDI